MLTQLVLWLLLTVLLVPAAAACGLAVRSFWWAATQQRPWRDCVLLGLGLLALSGLLVLTAWRLYGYAEDVRSGPTGRSYFQESSVNSHSCGEV